MKKLHTLLALTIVFGIFGLSSCEKLEKMTQKELSYSTTFTIPAPIEADKEYAITSEKFEPKIDETLEKYSSKKDLIEKLNITEAILNIENSETTFSFVKNVNMFLIVDGKDKIKVASKQIDALKATKTLELEVDSELDLIQFLNKEFVQVILEGTTHEELTEELEVKVDFKYLVDFKILGK